MKSNLVEEIQSRGYWRVNFQPLAPPYNGPLKLTRCAQLVREHAVRLRGWDYPHVPERTGHDTGFDRMDNLVQGWTDWNDHREFWRMYASSQFLHYRAVHEDWPELARYLGAPAPRPRWVAEGQRRLGLIDNLWLIAEVTEFLSRLVTSAGLYDEGVRLSLELRSGTPERALYVDDSGRVGFSYPRTSQAETITFRKDLTPAHAAEPKSVAVEAALHVFDRFGWTPSTEQLRADINKLYNLS